jgi:hypothetical protein
MNWQRKCTHNGEINRQMDLIDRFDREINREVDREKNREIDRLRD